MRWSCKSQGVRQGDGHKVGLYAKEPIHDIQEERSKKARKTSPRMPTYGKKFEREIRKSMAEAAGRVAKAVEILLRRAPSI